MDSDLKPTLETHPDNETSFRVRISFDTNFDIPTPTENGNGGKLIRTKDYLSNLIHNEVNYYLTPFKYRIKNQKKGITCTSSEIDKINISFVFQELLDNPERLFKEMIFMGNGDYSLKKREVLLGRLEEALNVLNYAQQNGLQGHEFDHESDARDTQYIENVVKDVAMALTGKEIAFKE